MMINNKDAISGVIRITCDPSLHHHAFTVESIALATAVSVSSDLPVHSDCKGDIGLIARS